MNPLIQLRKAAPLPSLTVLVFLCLALAPLAEGVFPPPDGGYPGFNTAEGKNALFNLTTGVGNAAVGWYSLFSNTDGSYNTALGAGTLLFNVGDQNTGEGTQNTAIGTGALLSNSTGFDNTANGALALFNNTMGSFNTAVGNSALYNNTASTNTAIGADALLDNTGGDSNTAVGASALSNNATGVLNTAIGVAAGGNQTTGNNNVYIGANMRGVAGESNACYIRGIFGQASASGTLVFINASGKLGTTGSSKRFKEHIKPMDQTSEALFALKPVAFRYKKEIDPVSRSHFGLVAEDVEKVNPDLVVRDKEGKPYSVRYDQVNAMLLNEFLKAHCKIEEQEAAITRQQKQIEALTASLQKLSAQVELSKPTPQTVLNNQ
jgi:trimeric autotransporter adhesin